MIAGPNDRLAIVFFGKYFFGKGKSPIDMERSQGVKKLLRSSTRVHIIRMHEHERLRNPFHNPIIRSHRKTSFALSVFFAFNLVMAEHSKFFGIDTLGPVERQSRHRTYKKCKRKQKTGNVLGTLVSSTAKRMNRGRLFMMAVGAK